MVVIPPEFKAAELREEDMYEGTEVDKNVADGKIIQNACAAKFRAGARLKIGH